MGTTRGADCRGSAITAPFALQYGFLISERKLISARPVPDIYALKSVAAQRWNRALSSLPAANSAMRYPAAVSARFTMATNDPNSAGCKRHDGRTSDVADTHGPHPGPEDSSVGPVIVAHHPNECKSKDFGRPSSPALRNPTLGCHQFITRARRQLVPITSIPGTNLRATAKVDKVDEAYFQETIVPLLSEPGGLAPRQPESDASGDEGGRLSNAS
jgi:hypothetical protein